jgi:serine protease AprX
MKFKSILILFVLFGQMAMSPPQSNLEKVWVFFTDKDTSNFNPFTFFDSKAIERRVLEGIDLYALTDIPVKASYVAKVENLTGSNRAVSRWFNAMCCLATEQQIQELKKLDFVQDVRITNLPINFNYHSSMQGELNQTSFDLDDNQRQFVHAQLQRMSGRTFQDNKINGKGVRIAIFDIGFKSYLTNPAFEHIRKENRIKLTYDFAKKKENVDLGGTHGTFVMSCIGGQIDGVSLGLATGAEFILARTETRTEFYAEEENWLAAAEWADRNGADIINSSLGYTYHRYFREDMDGEKSLVAKAANMAASKGILVINSAGNDGSGDWKVIGTPADADSVLSVGGIEPKSGIHTSFSSFGPTRDKRLKPNVTAYGHVIGSGPKGLSKTQGTSFSSPLVAGFAACAKQIRPAYTNMSLFKEIEASGDLYPYFDYAHGYGVPQATYFFKRPTLLSPTFTIESKGDRLYIRLMSLENESLRSDSSHIIYHDRYLAFPSYVFYHIENKEKYLDRYVVVDPVGSLSKRIMEMSGDEKDSPLAGEGPLVVKKSDHVRPFILRVYYKGYSDEIEIK